MLEKRFLKKFANDEKYQNFKAHSICNLVHSICNSGFNVPQEIPVVFHNRSNYDFIIKEFANEFEEQFKCFGENTENYKTISFQIKKSYKN